MFPSGPATPYFIAIILIIVGNLILNPEQGSIITRKNFPIHNPFPHLWFNIHTDKASFSNPEDEQEMGES